MVQVLDVPVGSLLAGSPLVLREHDTVAMAVEEMSKANKGSVIIVNDELKPIGIFTERDLLMRVCARGLDMKTTTLGSVMTRNPVTVNENDSARRVMELMNHFGFRHVPVVDEEGRLIGVVSLRDISRLLAGEVDVDELHSAG